MDVLFSTHMQPKFNTSASGIYILTCVFHFDGDVNAMLCYMLALQANITC